MYFSEKFDSNQMIGSMNNSTCETGKLFKFPIEKNK